MDASFWHHRWETNHIGFHEGEANHALVQYFSKLSLAQNSRVFVPLCGKTRDIAWLLSKGHFVIGVELSELAVVQLFEELGADPAISKVGKLKHFSAENIDIYVGDIFNLSRNTIGLVDAVYDRAAAVALPDDMRSRYAKHLIEITENAPQLVICYEYDQALMDGPPFSVVGANVFRLYGGNYDLTLIANMDVSSDFYGKFPASESVWLLRRSEE